MKITADYLRFELSSLMQQEQEAQTTLHMIRGAIQLCHTMLKKAEAPEQPAETKGPQLVPDVSAETKSQ